MANERGNLLDRRKFHVMKSGSPQGMADGKMRRPGKASRNPEESARESDQLYRLVWSSGVDRPSLPHQSVGKQMMRVSRLVRPNVQLDPEGLD